MDFDFLGTDDGPPPFGLHAAHGGVAPGSRVSHSVAVRDLEKPVLGGDRAEFDGFEQNVETAVSAWVLDHVPHPLVKMRRGHLWC
jgi:hypothetical protein